MGWGEHLDLSAGGVVHGVHGELGEALALAGEAEHSVLLRVVTDLGEGVGYSVSILAR